MTKDRWPELCKSVEQDDGLVTRKIGGWSEEKLWFWHRYVDITTKSMVDNPNWNSLVYIDLFSGPGVCTIKDSGKRVPGSAIIAAMAAKQFSHMHCVELDKVNANALKQRLQTMPNRQSFTVYEDDCNSCIHEIVERIPPKALTLAFVDPEGLDFSFATIKALCTNRRADLLILFADAYDIVRNVDQYESRPNSKLDTLLGSDRWKLQWQNIHNRKSINICDFFATEFEQQLKIELGYKEFRRRRINGPNGALYTLIFASKHERGVDFWDKISAKNLDGQGELF